MQRALGTLFKSLRREDTILSLLARSRGCERDRSSMVRLCQRFTDTERFYAVRNMTLGLRNCDEGRYYQ
jgi:hypothetical protein